MPRRMIFFLAATLILVVAVLVHLFTTESDQFPIVQKCVIEGEDIFPIENAMDKERVDKISKILFKVKDDISLRQPLNLCVKKIKEHRDGMLDCYIAKSIEHDEFVKICFAPRGALFSIAFQE